MNTIQQLEEDLGDKKKLTKNQKSVKNKLKGKGEDYAKRFRFK